MGRVGAVAAVYLAAAALVTWPLVTIATTHLGALEGAGDPYLNLWILGWDIKTWLTDPGDVFRGRIFDAPIFHPATRTLTYSDHQLVQALAVAPLFALTGNLALCHNVVLLVSIAASGAAMHVLAKGVTGSTAAAFVAGLAWACWPYHTAHLLHLQLQALYFLPLALWALLRVAAGRRWRDAAGLGLWSGLQAVVSVYYGVMTAITLLVAAPVMGWMTGQWRRSTYISRLLVAAVIATAVVAPVAIPYLRAKQAEGFGRNLYEAASHAASLQSYTQVPPDNLVYGRTGLLAPRTPAPGERDRRHVEHQMFPGIVLIGLALMGARVGWRSDRRPVVAGSVALIIVGAWLSAGPEGPLGLYAWVARHMFGFDAVRAPARFGIVVMLGAATLAAVAVASMPERWRRTGAVAISALMLAEYVNAPLPFVTAPPMTTSVGRWLADAPVPGAVLYLPIGLDRENTPYMVESLEHGRPIVNGYSGQRPAFFSGAVDALATLPAVDGRAMLRELGVAYVVSDRPIDGADGPGMPFVERAALDGRVIYEVAWTEEAEAALDAGEGPVPPAPGRLPFPDGEIATYDVRWLGDVPAGRVVLRARHANDAERAEAGAAWHFGATADTAPWVSRFFEARDRFETLATPDLFPIRHQREIREGARNMTRAYLYDADNGRVRIGSTSADAAADSAQTSPLKRGARDVITALFYARTLPLSVGDDVAVPVNDAGRHLIVRVRVDGRDTVTAPWGQTAALRLSPIIERGLDRRQPVEASMWMTDDDRRVPVRLEVSAGFGRLHVELVDYRP